MEHALTRTEWLIGATAVAQLNASSVLILGVGGVGSFAAEALARSGIGTLMLVDHDYVDPTNLNRQIQALQTTVGLPKASVLQERLLQTIPGINVQSRVESFSSENSGTFFNRHWDFVIDAMDSVSAKVEVIRLCRQRSIPVISCMGAGNRLDPEKITVTDLADTHGCPLARIMRKELRKINIHHVDVVFSSETPVTIHRPKTAGGSPASISYVPSVAGLMMAGHVVRRLIKTNENHTGRVLRETNRPSDQD